MAAAITSVCISLFSGRGCCRKSQALSGSPVTSRLVLELPCLLWLKELVFDLQFVSHAVNRARDEGCRAKSGQIPACYSVTFLLLTKNRMLTVKQPSLPTNSLSPEKRHGRHGLIASGRTNNEGKDDLTLL